MKHLTNRPQFSMVYIDHRNDVIKCSKLKWNHELQASGFTAKFWTFFGVISMVYKSVDQRKLWSICFLQQHIFFLWKTKLHAIRPPLCLLTTKTTKLIFRLGFATGTPRTMTTDKVRYYAGTTHSNIIIRFVATVRNPKQDETIVLQCGPALFLWLLVSCWHIAELIFISLCIKLAAFLVRV